MAEALFNGYSAGRAVAYPAGTRPAAHKDRNVAKAMSEVGIDISSQQPKALTPEMLEGAERAITMCGAESVCPAASVPVEDWGLEDPEGLPMEKVRAIREEIDARVRVLIGEMKL